MNDIPLSLYIHIPWCVKKCFYCDFNSHTNSNIPEQEYIDALILDLKQDLEYINNKSLKTIYIGGGTPSLFSADSIKAILERINQEIPIDKDAEISMEANPGTIEHDSFNKYKQAGINRVSLGVQSFNDQILPVLGRVHDNAQAIKAINELINTDFNSFNLDLMYGLPGQSIEMALNDLQIAINFNPIHLSWYNLTIEPNTIFYAKRPLLPSDESIYTIETKGVELLKNNNYEHYEISAFAQNSQYCKHNINYWEFGDYLGIGAGAHSKLTISLPDKIIRLNKSRQPNHYLKRATQKDFIADKRILTKNELGFEFMLNYLRLKKPLPINHFVKYTGLSLNYLEPGLDDAINKGLITTDESFIYLTNLGMRFLNDTMQAFLR